MQKFHSQLKSAGCSNFLETVPQNCFGLYLHLTITTAFPRSEFSPFGLSYLFNFSESTERSLNLLSSRKILIVLAIFL